MNLVSLKLELAEIICKYAEHQKSTYSNTQSILTIPESDLGELSEEHQVEKLKRAVRAINVRRDSREAHLLLIIELIEKINAVEAHINQSAVTREDATPIFEELHEDIQTLVNTYEELLDSEKERQDKTYQYKPFGESEAKTVTLNPLLKERNRLMTNFTGDLKQLGKNIRDELPALKRSLKSKMNSLEQAEERKELQRLRDEVQRLQDENRDLRSAVGQDKNMVAALDVIRRRGLGFFLARLGTEEASAAASTEVERATPQQP